MKTNINNLDKHLKTLWANINDNHLGGVFDILSDAMVELNMIRMKANGAEQSESNCNIPLISNSLPNDVPLFVDWLDKYYIHAGNDDLYKRKDNGKIEPQRKLYNDYKRAYKLGNDS